MSVLGYWLKTGYLSLMPSFFLGPGTDAMNQYLSDALKSNDVEAIDILTKLGAKPDEKLITEVIQSGSVQSLKILCTASPDVKEKILSEVRSSGNLELWNSLRTNNVAEIKNSASSQSIFKSTANSSNDPQETKQNLDESDKQRPKF